MERINQKKAGIMITYLTMGLRVLISFVFTPFLLARVGDSQYGVYSLSVSLISFISLLDMGFSQTLVRYIARARALDDKDEEARLNGFFLKLYIFIAVIAFVVGLALVFLYPLVSKKTMLDSELRLFKAVFLVLLADTVIAFLWSRSSIACTAKRKSGYALALRDTKKKKRERFFCFPFLFS